MHAQQNAVHDAAATDGLGLVTLAKQSLLSSAGCTVQHGVAAPCDPQSWPHLNVSLQPSWKASMLAGSMWGPKLAPAPCSSTDTSASVPAPGPLPVNAHMRRRGVNQSGNQAMNGLTRAGWCTV